MAVMTSFHAGKCFHLVDKLVRFTNIVLLLLLLLLLNRKCLPAPMRSACKFLIYSTLVLVVIIIISTMQLFSP